MELVRIGNGAQWDWYTMGPVHSGTDKHWDWYTVRLGRYTMGLVHSGTSTQ